VSKKAVGKPAHCKTHLASCIIMSDPVLGIIDPFSITPGLNCRSAPYCTFNLDLETDGGEEVEMWF